MGAFGLIGVAIQLFRYLLEWDVDDGEIAGG